MLVVGDREVGKGTVAVRSRTAGDQGASTVDDLVLALHAEVRAKRSPEAERTG
jgi:threonyl-tRNA synthetase